MFKTPLNLRTVTLELKRREVIDLLIACTSLMQMDDASSSKWFELHEKLTMILAYSDLKE